MSRSCSRFATLVFIILCFALVQCGGSSTFDQVSLGKVPDSWIKYLTVGAVSATLDVYRSDGDLETHLDLNVDVNDGTVSAPQFKIPIGDTYRFVIIFQYALSSSEAIPYAYADFTWLVDEFSEEVTFSENDIRYGYDTKDPFISTSLSEGKIPNLDLDGDGWTNWEELRDKVNPKNSNSVPIAPSVEVRGQQDGNGTTATIVVTARDNAHVEDLRLVDPLCGVTVISDTLVNNVDASVTRTLTLRLDLLSVSKNPRALQGIADDGVTPSQNANETLNFSLTGSASQPYFVFTEPEEKGEVEGDAVFRGIACSRAEIDLASLHFTHQEIASTSWTGQKNPSGDFEMTSEAVNTTVLPDGLVTLQVEVRDSNNKIGQGSRVFSVVNDSQIKVVSPVGRRWVFGNDQIAVTVKNLPDSNLVVVEGSPNFSLTSSTAGGAVGRLTVGNLPEGTVLPLTFKAVRSDGSEVTRTVEFTVRNKPQIQFSPEATKVFRNWSTNLFYKVVNVDPQQLYVAGVPSDSKGDRVCEEDAVAKGITVCTGKFPVKLVNAQSFSISATRGPTSEETCNNCVSDSNSGTVNVSSSLPKDVPEINAAIVGDDEPEAPSRIKFPTESPVQHYRLIVKDTRDDTEIFNDELQSDETAILNLLEPRKDYRATLQVLNGAGGNVLAEMFKEFTTGDIGLVGWWRFGKGSTIDFSGNSLLLHSNGDPIISLGSVLLDGNDDSFSINDGAILNPASISVEAIFQTDGGAGEQHLFDKRNGSVSGPNLRIQGAAYPLDLVFLMRRDSGPEEFVNINHIIEDGIKYFIVASFEHIAPQNMRLYINGQEKISKMPTTAINRSQLSAAQSFIGQLSWGNDNFFKGKLFELAIYEHVLCNHDIWSHCIAMEGIDCGAEPAECF